MPQSLALPHGIKHEALMIADHVAFRRAYLPGRLGQIPVEKLAERTLADEADAGRVFSVVVRESRAPGDLAGVALVERAQGEERFRELALVQAIEKIALVLGAVLPP
jgi:hypothetical protein